MVGDFASSHQGDLSRGDLLAAGDLDDQVNNRLVRLQSLGSEAGEAAADVVGSKRLRASDSAGEESLPQR